MTPTATQQLDMEIQDHLIKIAADVAETKTTTLALRDDIIQVKEYQKAQNGRVFQLADKVNMLEKHVVETDLATKVTSEITSLKIDLAKKDEHAKTNNTWLAVLYSIFGGLVVIAGKSLIPFLLGK